MSKSDTDRSFRNNLEMAFDRNKMIKARKLLRTMTYSEGVGVVKAFLTVHGNY